MSLPLRKEAITQGRDFCLPVFSPESGGELSGVEVAYETYGTLQADGSNAILLCHALTGDAHAGDGEGRPGWWGSLIGPGRPLDTSRYFIVCSNVLGGCAGTTGPTSHEPESVSVYGGRFPVVTIRDMVRVQRQLLTALGVRRLEAVLGGSMGGMQALEWAVMYPDFCARAGVIAATPVFSTMGLAYNQVMREAIVMDPDFCDGDYAQVGVFPAAGLRVARMLGMITYRTAELFEERFGRTTLNEQLGQWQIGNYLRHQGDKLVERFDANAYLTLMGAMDLHDIGRGRGGVTEALRKVTAKLSFVGIDDDLLYPAVALQAATEEAKSYGIHASYTHIHSRFGHDAFLLEFAQLTDWLLDFLDV